MGAAMRYWCAVFQRAILDTFHFLGWQSNSIIYGILLLFGFILHWRIRGWEAMMGELDVWIVYVLAPLGVFTIILLLYNLFMTPVRLARQGEQKYNVDVDSLKADIANLNQKLSSAQAELQRRLSTAEELQGSYFEDKVICVRDLVKEEPIVEGKEFRYCHLYGPAIVQFDNCVVSGANFDLSGAKGLESMLYELPPRELVGVIGFFSCTFRDCTFHKIGIVGPKEGIDKIRAITKYRPS